MRQIFALVPSHPKESERAIQPAKDSKWAVRDPIEQWSPDKQTGKLVSTLVDPGVEDKRLLAIEEEFAQALRVAQRPGNIWRVRKRL